jgi:uncharacterized protein
MNSTCPICGEPRARTDNPYLPFCSERCQLVDLGRWLNEDYRIPGEPVGEPVDEPVDDDGKLAPDQAH